MASGEDWLLRPVLAGLCKFESIVNGTLDLEAIAVLNDALDVQTENTERLQRAVKQHG